MFLTLVPCKIFVITIIAKTLELVFIHFFPVNLWILRGVAGGAILVGLGKEERRVFLFGRRQYFVLPWLIE
jgi:hypothetical protein